MIKGLQSFSTDFNDSYQFRIVTPGCRLFEATVVRKLTLRFGTSLGWDLFNIANIFPIIKIFSLNLLHLMNWQCVPFYAPSSFKLLREGFQKKCGIFHLGGGRSAMANFQLKKNKIKWVPFQLRSCSVGCLKP